MPLPNVREEFDPVHARHLVVRDHRVERLAGEDVERGVARAAGHHPERPGPLKEKLPDLEQGGLVVDQQDPERGGHGSF